MNNQISHLFTLTGMLIVKQSEKDDNEEDEKNTITKNIMWDRDRWDYVDY